MPEDLSSLKKRRGAVKSALTRFKSFLDNYNANTDVEVLKMRLERAKSLLTDFEKIHLEIEILEDVDDEASKQLFEEHYFEYVAKAQSLLEKHPRISASRNTNDSFASSTPVMSMNSAQVESNIKLPSITLPKFDGKYEEWLSFEDNFRALVHSNARIQPVQKFNYLKSCLSGSAAQIIHSLASTDENYEIAWRLLTERFSNKRIIIQNHVRALFELSAVTKEAMSNLNSLIDTAQKHIQSLNALGQPTDQWNGLLLHLITSKLDKVTHREWENSLNGTELPNINDLWKFLRNKCHVLQAVAGETCNSSKGTNKTRQVLLEAQAKARCCVCSKNHSIIFCDSFKQLDHSKRLEVVKKAGLCFNCLRSNHQVSSCNAGNCKKCNKRHNTLLHFSNAQTADMNTKDNVNHNSAEQVIQQPHAGTPQVLSSRFNSSSQVILSTALIDIKDSKGHFHTCRAVLDTGSQSNFITSHLCSKLNLPKRSFGVPIQGIGNSLSHIKYTTNTIIRSRSNAFSLDLQLLVISNITTLLPSQPIDHAKLGIPHNVELADPEFHKPANVDILIGAEHFYHLLCVGQIKLKSQAIIIQNSQLGWIVTGKACVENPNRSLICHLSRDTLDNLVQRFWETEELPAKRLLSPDEEQCEAHFLSTYKRDESGRVSVGLPFNAKKNELGDSFVNAKRRFHSLEKRLIADPDLYEAYRKFLQDYESLNHMTEMNQANTDGSYYIPHHAIVKGSSLTTKLRVVFDASAKTTTGLSLNDVLLTGPIVQNDLFDIIMRFRTHKVAFTADVQQMYRQFLINKQDRPFQRILWRNSQDEPLRIFELNTVTYGTTSAPFLATRALLQLAKDEQHRFPRGAEVISRDMYVDDLLSGTQSLEQALQLKEEIIQLLQSGGLVLRKWASNDPQFMESFAHQDNDPHLLLILTEVQKTLGIGWIPQQDLLVYRISLTPEPLRITKRVILSQTATLFDPLGLLSPVLVIAKILLQTLWKLQLGWDDTVPCHISSQWKHFLDELPIINQLTFARQICISDPVNLQLHAFADASEVAYGACIFLRSTNKEGSHLVSLVCSKSRVAPLKRISLPRLELCAALLLSRLLTVVRDALGLPLRRIILWSDSTIVLQWIQTPPHRLKTFVANRITEIQQHTRYCEWRHVPSGDNPADIISRGLMPKQLMESHLWKHGPPWLNLEEETWPNQDSSMPEPLELRTFISSSNNDTWIILHRFSGISTLQRVLGWCYRFIHNAQSKTKTSGELSVTELQHAMRSILKTVQRQTFASEIKDLSQGNSTNKHSKLLSLNPLLDSNHILRVGGRLMHSTLTYDQKHPIILPQKHVITDMIIQSTHKLLGHAGPQATLYALRQKYWIINGRSRIRKIVHECAICFRMRPQLTTYQMGDLPRERFQSFRPFVNVGVDFCGPFFIKEKKFKNRNKVKIYVAVFICLASKAVHLEVVSDLTTEAFCAALKRFFCRRGKSHLLLSDNATNFVGTSNYLRELYDFIRSKTFNQGISKWLSNQEVSWRFIPPRSPHFGGIWEAAVKSFKFHLVRIAKNTLFTYEQFNTLVIEIEGILNSRPLTPISQDPEDLIALTPSHFLIGDSLLSVPESDFTLTPTNRLSDWQHIQKLKRDFWNRWHKEYLNELNQRSRWKSQGPRNIAIGDLVLIKEDNSPPLNWPMGRVLEIHPGNDNIVRVVTIKTVTGVYKRNVRSLAMFPIAITDSR